MAQMELYEGLLPHPSVFKKGFTVHCSLVPRSCQTLWDPMDCSLPGSSAHGIFHYMPPAQQSACNQFVMLQVILPSLFFLFHLSGLSTLSDKEGKITKWWAMFCLDWSMWKYRPLKPRWLQGEPPIRLPVLCGHWGLLLFSSSLQKVPKMKIQYF